MCKKNLLKCQKVSKYYENDCTPMIVPYAQFIKRCMLLFTQILHRFDFRGSSVSDIQIFLALQSVYDGTFYKNSE